MAVGTIKGNAKGNPKNSSGQGTDQLTEHKEKSQMWESDIPFPTTEKAAWKLGVTDCFRSGIHGEARTGSGNLRTREPK